MVYDPRKKPDRKCTADIWWGRGNVGAKWILLYYQKNDEKFKNVHQRRRHHLKRAHEEGVAQPSWTIRQRGKIKLQ
jgi:hypothetical protein